jgi:2-phosphosulfolactate phosphatase
VTTTKTATSGGEADVSQVSAAWRLDWGAEGLRALAPHSDVVVIVDVLRFSSAVCAALEAGMTVWPFPCEHGDAAAYAAERQAILAGRREFGELSLSPTDLLNGPAGTRLVLPSPNGSFLSFGARAAGADWVLAGCLRNASAVAAVARRLAGPDGAVAVIAAGERWGTPAGPLRPAVEDLLGAGAILAALDPSGAASPPKCSPEAAAARAAFRDAAPDLGAALRDSASGRELCGRGWDDDVDMAAALDATSVVPLLDGECFRPAA